MPMAEQAPGHAPAARGGEPFALAGPGTVVPPAGGKVNLVGLLLALRRRWFVALLLGLPLAIPVAIAAWYLTPTTFSGRTLIEVAAVRPSVLIDGGADRGGFEAYQRAQ